MQTFIPAGNIRQWLEPLRLRPLCFFLAGLLPAPALVWHFYLPSRAQLREGGPGFGFKRLPGLLFLVSLIVLSFTVCLAGAGRRKEAKNIFPTAMPLCRRVLEGLCLFLLGFATGLAVALFRVTGLVDMPGRVSGLEAVVVKTDRANLVRSIYEQAGLSVKSSDQLAKDRTTRGEKKGWTRAAARRTFYLRTDRGGKLLLQLDGGPELQLGDRIRLSGATSPILGARNPGGFPADRYYASEGILLQMNPAPGAARKIAGPRPGLWRSLFDRARVKLHNFRRFLAARLIVLAGPGAGGLGAALLLGLSDLLDNDTTADFYAGGMGHLLAVSGTHMGILSDLTDLAIASSPLRRKYACPCRLLAITGILLLTGGGVSVWRAFIMRLLSLLCEWRRRRGDSLNHLLMAMIFLLLKNPFFLFKRGFHFSCSVTGGLLLFLPLVKARWPQLGRAGDLPVLKRQLLVLLLPACIAYLSALPLQLLFAGKLNILSIPANGLAIPLVHLLILFSLAAELPLLGFVAALPLKGASHLLRGLAAFSARAESAPLPPHLSFSLAVGLLFCAYLKLSAGRKLRRRLSSLLLLIYGLGGAFFVFRPVPQLTLYCFDVGQGDSLLLTAKGSSLLVDTGTAQAAEKHLLPALAALNISYLDCLVITHLDADHCGGAEALLRAVRVNTILAPPEKLIRGEKPRLGALIKEKGIRLASPRAGQMLKVGQGLSFRVLNPPHYTDGKNEDSIVLRGGSGAISLLLTGDIGMATEDRLLGSSEGLPADLLKVAHHGSKNSSKPTFLEAVSPRAAIASVGANNRYGHPADSVIQSLARQNIRFFRTDRDGCIRVVYPGLDEFTIDTFLSRKKKGFKLVENKSMVE